ncbi:citrate synthase [Xylariaceae sp. FL0016]|nr:citrate synthase [Xylariaceae sp. FL0016]
MANPLSPLLAFLRGIVDLLFRFISRSRLWVIDSRTFRLYSIPIKNNAVQATEFMKVSPLGIRASYQEHAAKGLMLLDPGFRNTAVGESRIVHIDGNRGILQYRQYPIGYLVQNHDYEDVMYLLIWEHLPSRDEKMKFRAQLAEQMVPHKSVVNTIQAFRYQPTPFSVSYKHLILHSPDAPAFLIVSAGLSAWAASSPENVPSYRGRSIYGKDAHAVEDGIYRTLAAFTTVTALTYCHQEGQACTAKPDPALSSIDNMLVMMGRTDSTGQPEPKAVAAFNKLWILFADHEITNSTSAFLNATSCLSDPVSAVAASVASANGPLHAGAIDLAYKSFAQLGSKEGVQRHLANVRAKKCRLMGVGHRVYRTVDPRLHFIRAVLADLETTAPQSPFLEVAMEIERSVMTDSYFTSRNLSINADLYSSFAYAALGFEPRIFTSFAMTARCAGVMAHWRESMSQPPCLWRPRQIFTGEVAS